MPPRAFATQRVQIGKETVPGQVVPAINRLQALRVPLAPHFETERFAPSGNTAPTINIMNQEWTEADVEGRMTYTDAGYVFASAIGKPVTSVPTATPAPAVAKQHVFTYDGITPADPQTYTVEYGDPTLARRVANAIFNGVSFTIARDGLEFSSALMAHQVVTGTPLTTTGVTAIEPVPIAAGQWDVYVDDTFANLGTTKFLDAYRAEFEVAERFDAVWPINSALKSYGGLVEKAADDQEHTGTLTIGASASMEGYLDTVRTGAKKFIRLEALGPVIEGTIKHRMTIDLCAFITETDGYDEENGLLVLPFGFQAGRDNGWDRSIVVTLVNGVATY